MRKEHRDKLVDRLDRALQDMYHNATPNYPDCQNEYEQGIFDDWFGGTAQFEIEYIADGGACGLVPYGKTDPYKDKPAYIRNMKNEQWLRDRMLWERITEFGKLYTWGRGGRTLAPEQLIKTGGGSSFWVRNGVSVAEDLNAEALTDAILVIESFNQYVEDWNKSVASMWKEYKDEDPELQKEIDAHDGKRKVYREVWV